MDWKLELVIIPVTDVDRAKHFYAEQLGFNVDHDTAVSDELRIVQLTPPSSGCSIAIGTGLGDMVPGSMKGMQLVVADVQAAREQLAKQDVDVSEVRHMETGEWVSGPGGRWNSFIFFSDPDGNAWSVQERPAEG
jgi:catechol 2,3-dioxygenase-like lactoylglutathione lyase family enzyme